jgi:hypothetical protein
MAKTTSREERAEARAKRRARTAPEPPELEEAVGGDGTPSPADALRSAASAAIAAAAVGAAQALVRRRHEGEEDADGDDDTEEPEAHADEPPEEPDAEPETADGPQVQEAPRDERRQSEEPQPIAAGDARRIVESARQQLSDLRGAEAESVSSIRRTSDGWHVGLEVVEVHRIPESTDVLATYEVTLDGDGNLLTFQRTRRYYRSEAERQ